MNHGENVLGF
ncbi:Protein of unknown function [Bacillus mycoides]|uniref:Uncharacterized protein n=1 Tax=Bacillus mycoides TaxID=1405 RepID=A0A1C4CCJ9_BACMY|nr:Protein of unknown function [Bacillus mycoides]SCC16830.1 Protein of unknown function [Bacillus mycoides]